MIEILVQRLAFPIWLLTRGVTLGVRAVVLKQNSVLLVRHTYLPGWHFPGGGVDRGETLEGALKRECREEAGIEIGQAGELHGLFQNRTMFRRDHVGVFVVRDWTMPQAFVPNKEIREAEFFPLDALPETTSRGTRNRIAEIFGGESKSPYWS